MSTSLRPWQVAIVAVLTALNCYSIAQGFAYKSFIGILLAVASLTVLGFCIKMFRSMNRMAENAEDVS
ncbi:hypothetical protein QTN47_06000 [Danxiaibacter flavus]|uniref:Uncharacterized protein n=1 Tax=Danxiaibacter flavus TaxID=3049108 RepID=A0ABV3ZAY8_9BACT|nr:hypothetical protein QNM32_06000 [Chitinophagaceae bacterium DXS]